MYKCPDTSVRILWVRSVLGPNCPAPAISSHTGDQGKVPERSLLYGLLVTRAGWDVIALVSYYSYSSRSVAVSSSANTMPAISVVSCVTAVHLTLVNTASASHPAAEADFYHDGFRVNGVLGYGHTYTQSFIVELTKHKSYFYTLNNDKMSTVTIIWTSLFPEENRMMIGFRY